MSVTALLQQMRGARMPATCRTEFPDFDSDMPVLAGFSDASWCMDACPKLASDDGKLIIWVDYVDPSKRDSESKHRFAVCDNETEPSTVLFQSNDWSAVVAITALLKSAINAESLQTLSNKAPMGSNRIVEVV